MTNRNELIFRIQKGERLLFNELVKACNQYLHNFLSKKLTSFGRKDILEDALQVTWMKINLNIHSFDTNKGEFHSWAATIAINTCFNMLNKKVDQLVNDPDDQTYIAKNVYIDYSPEDSYLNSEQIRVVRECIAMLPERQRKALTLQLYYDKSYLEIANIMKTTEASVRSLLTRARHKFEELYKMYDQ